MTQRRRKPLQFSYAGMVFKIGILKSNRRVDISYKSDTMKTAFTREFVPVCISPDCVSETPKTEDNGSTVDTQILLQTGEYPTENIIRWTLQKKLPR